MSLVKSPSKRPSNGGGLLSHDPFFNFWDTNRRLMNFDRLFNGLSSEIDLPPLNIKDKGNHYEIEMAAPGLTKDHFEIEFNNDLLTISANKEENREEKEEDYITREYNYQTFSRSISIPDNVDDSKEIKAHYENGVLKIDLMKKNSSVSKSKKVKVS
ncbi:heat-shock protein [Christiangramia fulva]|uniref:Heat-shock protein n=1 Tax=Christiangramia fulva TaxID=2126553 RepID=A0A2R3Z4D9_9FLAO|nr:Hsp20/alpha crystallin family protein [Christiangramia fulva]AVR45104.1 heat-shock protein [Christiangramia fulva]